ncbi:MAG: glucose-6-phosphate isomerase [Pseudomonadota bacterium]
MNPTTTDAWHALGALESEPASVEPAPRSLVLGELCLDLSRQRLNPEAWSTLVRFAREMGLEAAIAAQLRGDHINNTEDRPALHSALRARADERPAAVAEAIDDTLEQMIGFAEDVRANRRRGYTGRAFKTVVHIGIGGSHLGPELVYDALRDPTDRLSVRFIANLDGHAATEALRDLDPETTLFIVASKSFGTLETRLNAEFARSWFIERTPAQQVKSAVAAHFIAVSSNLEAVERFGIDPANTFAMWDWVGGRYSVWSAVGIPLLLAFGEAAFRDFLAGARLVDRHLAEEPLEQNAPVLMALAGLFNYNFRGAESLAVLSYDRRLRLLPDFLQQLEMESNGKSVDRDGNPVACQTMPVLWGGEETNGQHAFHQLLHQGNRAFTADFVGVVRPAHDRREQHLWQLANLLGQAEAMEQGDDPADPARRVAGARPTTTILLRELSPSALGTLLALYEQKVFCQGVFWNINSFDQWGVELGKKLAERVFPALQGDERLDERSGNSQRLIDHIHDLGSA